MTALGAVTFQMSVCTEISWTRYGFDQKNLRRHQQCAHRSQLSKVDTWHGSNKGALIIVCHALKGSQKYAFGVFRQVFKNTGPISWNPQPGCALPTSEANGKHLIRELKRQRGAIEQTLRSPLSGVNQEREHSVLFQCLGHASGSDAGASRWGKITEFRMYGAFMHPP